MARKSRKGVSAPEQPKKDYMKIWRTALYIRLSVEFNGKRGDSLETQRQIMEAYAALCPDLEIVEVYTDNGITGRTFEREAFQRMLADVDAGKINCIMVKDLSRLGRNTIDTGYYIEKYFPLHRVRFIAVNDQFDSEDSENSGNHLIVPLKNMINEAYAADISKKVRAQQNQAMRDGEFVGARPPYGYRKDPDNCHRLLVNEDTAPIVRQIFQWTVDGVALNVIVKRLNEQGVMTPGYYLASIGLITSKKLMGSGKWQTWTVGKILADEVYTGDMVQGKHTNVGHKQVVTKPVDWIVVRNTHEPLVSREVFAKAQAVREQMASKYTRTMKVPYSENILRGRVFCAHCGKNLHRQRSHGRYFYRCISNDRMGEGSCTGGIIHLPEPDLFDAILTIIRQKAEVVMGEALRLKRCDNKIATQKAQVDQEIAELGRQTQKNKTIRAGLYENFVKGILTRAEYLEMQEDYSQKISGAVERVQQLQTRQSELERQMECCTSMADKLAAVDKDTALSALLVEQLIERVTVNGPDDVSVKFSFEGGFERVMEVLGNE
jgi:DNA invertase Pin-like site-specific DNA recombinase